MGGSLVPVQIIGFAHDGKTDGGKAGITFQFVDCIAEREMNPLSKDEADYNAYAEQEQRTLSEVMEYYSDGVHTNAGGWESSSMREWLNNDLLGRLPEDLSSVIVAVDKQTNNIGWTKEGLEGVVTTTSDKLWLPSIAELRGGVTEAEAEYSYVVDVINAEGQEYKLFRDMNVLNDSENPILGKNYNGSSCLWWERSPGLNYAGTFCIVSSDALLYSVSGADTSYGVSPGFCI